MSGTKTAGPEARTEPEAPTEDKTRYRVVCDACGWESAILFSTDLQAEQDADRHNADVHRSEPKAAVEEVRLE